MNIGYYHDPKFPMWVYIIFFTLFITFTVVIEYTNNLREENEKKEYYQIGLNFKVTNKVDFTKKRSTRKIISKEGEIKFSYSYTNLWNSIEIGDSITKLKNDLQIKLYRNNNLIDSFVPYMLHE